MIDTSADAATNPFRDAEADEIGIEVFRELLYVVLFGGLLWIALALSVTTNLS